MKILLVNTFDKGGAANSCVRLHNELLINNNSSLLLKNKTNHVPSSFTYYKNLPKTSRLIKIKNKLKKIISNFFFSEKEQNKKMVLKNRSSGLDYFSFPETNYDITKTNLYKSADIINLHWVADFLDWKTFFKKNTKPVVWTLHDENPYLGGEHYNEKYFGIDDGGLPIERVYSDFEKKEISRQLNYKKEILKNISNIHIVSPSLWLLNSSKNSELFSKYPHYYIPYGYPVDVFKPYNKSFCREVLGIPIDKRVILFVSDSIKNSRKGFGYLKKAFEDISNEYKNDLFLCAVGSNLEVNLNENIIELGRINDEKLMAMVYSASDLFVIPSLYDNLPNTMIESLLCGTPVIGFNIGGIPDVVIDQKTGYLCPEISVQSLKETIEKFLINPDIFDREKIAAISKSKYASNIQAKNYIELYQKILNK